MSLLMDALKRAERARQAEADRAKAEGRDGDPASSSEMTLDPMEEDIGEARGAAHRSATPRTPAKSPPGSDTEDSLEFTPPEVRREIDAMDDLELGDTGNVDTDGVAPARAGAPGRADVTPPSLEYGDIPLDETASTLPSMRAAQRSVQDYFDGTQSMSLSMEEMQDAIAAGRDGEGAGGGDPESGARTSTMDGDTTSRRQAQAILDARAVAPSTTGRNVALVLLLLVLLGGIGGGAFLFKDRLQAMIDGEPGIVVHRPPVVRVAPPPAVPVVSAPSEQPKVLPAEQRDALLRAAEAAREEERRLAEVAASAAAAAAQAQAARAAQEQMAAARAAAPAGTAPVKESGEAAASPAVMAAAGASGAPGLRDAAAGDRAPGPDTVTERVPLAEVMREMNPGSAAGGLSGLRISKRRRESRTHAALVQAFDAFQRGDDGAAMTAYQEVLAREPRNRDAMLGAAAVMMRGGALEAAAGYYAELLRINPRDGAAQAALIALQEDLDPVSGESHVKSLLARDPDDANLHFTLGNLYAEQRRWPEAQRAYFDAYTLDNDNPDYAFNLAVSLDRLVQGRAAAAYYRRAMELAERRPAAFASADAARRLAVLGGS